MPDRPLDTRSRLRRISRRISRRVGAISAAAVAISLAISPVAEARSRPSTATVTANASTTAAAPESEAIVERREAASAHLREARRLRAEGYPATAADHLVTAFELLDDPKQWRDLRGVVMSQAYDAHLEAYNKAATSDEKLRHGCRLRKLLNAYVDGFRQGYGAEAESFPEVAAGQQKIASLELTIRTHGDPATLCAAIDDDGPLPTMPSTPLLLTAADKVTTRPIAADATEDPTHFESLPPKAYRSAKAMTATGATLVVAGGALLGVMSFYLVKGARLNEKAGALNEMEMLSDPDTLKYNGYVDDGRQANDIGQATGIIGGAVLVTGAVLTAVGRKRMQKNDLSIAPTATPTSAGAMMRFRF